MKTKRAAAANEPGSPAHVQGHEARPRRAGCASSGPSATCRCCAPSARASTKEKPAQGRADRRLPARHHRDGEPGAHAAGRRRRGLPVRLESAQHPGRRGRGARRRLRHLDLRHQGRGPQDLLLAHRLVHRGPAAHHDGRRLRPGHRAAHQEEGLPARRASPAPRRPRPASSACGRWPAGRMLALPGRSPSTTPTPSTCSTTATAPARARWTASCAHQHADRRLDRGDRRLRLVRPRRGDARAKGHGRHGARHRDQPGRGARGGDGRLPGGADGRGGARAATCSSP